MQEKTPINKDALRPDLIVKTIELLHQRIGERFPNSGLREVCKKVHDISLNMEMRADWIGRPVIWLRVLTYSVIVMVVTVSLIPILYHGQKTPEELELLATSELKDTLELIESGLNDVLMVGAAIFFLLTVEPRYKRQRALDAMHELRSLAHVIDMHQLTKDPHRIICEDGYNATSLSPTLKMTRFELHRYLDYCSEMLALIGKISAVYVQEFDDGVALATASELDMMTSGLSQKIWQKIAILSTFESAYANETKEGGLPGTPAPVLNSPIEKLPAEESTANDSP